MAIWYDANKKKYSSDGKESVIKSYIDERIAAEGVECEERLEAHAEGTSLRHSAEDVDYGGDKTVKEKIDDVKDALDTERTLRIAQGQDIMSEINDLRISSVYDNNALYNAIEVLKGPGDSENFGMVRTEGIDGGSGRTFMCKRIESAQNLNSYIYTGMYYLNIYAYSQNLPTGAGYEMVQGSNKGILIVTECGGKVVQWFYSIDNPVIFTRNGSVSGEFNDWKKCASDEDIKNLEDALTEVSTEFEDALTEVSTEFEDALTEVSTEFEDALTEVSTEFEDALTEVSTELEDALTEVSTEFEDALTEVSAEFEDALTEVSDELAEKEEKNLKGQPNGYAPLDGNKKIPEQYIYGKTAKEYGIRWTGTSVSTCTRLGAAAGLTAQAFKSEQQTYHSDFDDIYPWSDIKLCNIDENGQVTAYIGEPNFKRDGSNGDVMVEIPKFYYKRTKGKYLLTEDTSVVADKTYYTYTNGKYAEVENPTGNPSSLGYYEYNSKIEEWWICGEKLKGYELHPAFTNGGEEVQKLFIGAYSGSVETIDSVSKLRSKSAVLPMFNDSADNFRTYAQNKNSGTTPEERKNGNWGVEDYACLSALQMLYTIEFANMNSGDALGFGIRLNGLVAAGAAGVAKVKAAATDTNNITISKEYEVGEHIQIGSVYLTPDLVAWRTVTAVEKVDDSTYIITISGSPVTVNEGDYVWEIPPENGTCDFLNGGSGNPGTGGRYDDVCYRGIEGFTGKFQQFIDGISCNGSAHQMYVSNTMGDYASKKTDGTYEKISYLTSDKGWITEFGFDQYHKWVLMPVAIGGAASTYISGYFTNASGTKPLFYGKDYKSGGNKIYTLACITENKTADYNARLMFKK